MKFLKNKEPVFDVGVARAIAALAAVAHGNRQHDPWTWRAVALPLLRAAFAAAGTAEVYRVMRETFLAFRHCEWNEFNVLRGNSLDLVPYMPRRLPAA